MSNKALQFFPGAHDFTLNNPVIQNVEGDLNVNQFHGGK